MKKALVQNAADEAQVKAGASKEERRRFEETNDLRVVAAMVEGRRFLWRLLKMCQWNKSVVADSPYETYHKEGHRSVAIWVEEELKDANFDAFIQMQIEAKKEEELNAR